MPFAARGVGRAAPLFEQASSSNWAHRFSVDACNVNVIGGAAEATVIARGNSSHCHLGAGRDADRPSAPMQPARNEPGSTGNESKRNLG
jgi:hypothetical protein